jgi:hypothetical protein
MSQEIGDTVNPRWVTVFVASGCRLFGGGGGAEGGEDDGAGDAEVGGDRECVARVVVEPGEDLDVALVSEPVEDLPCVECSPMDTDALRHYCNDPKKCEDDRSTVPVTGWQEKVFFGKRPRFPNMTRVDCIDEVCGILTPVSLAFTNPRW